MVALLRELVAEGEPVFLNESLEAFHCAVVRIKKNLGERDDLRDHEEGIE